jgi:hypothetical protein
MPPKKKGDSARISADCRRQIAQAAAIRGAERCLQKRFVESLVLPDIAREAGAPAHVSRHQISVFWQVSCKG